MGHPYEIPENPVSMGLGAIVFPGTKKQKEKRQRGREEGREKERNETYTRIISHVPQKEIPDKLSPKILSEHQILFICQGDVALWFHKAFLHKIRFYLGKQSECPVQLIREARFTLCGSMTYFGSQNQEVERGTFCILP